MWQQWHHSEGRNMELDTHKDQKKGRRKQQHLCEIFQNEALKFWNTHLGGRLLMLADFTY